MATITELYPVEGNSQRLDGGAMFGNCPKALWQDWTEVDEKNRIRLSCRALLVKTDDGRHVLFETGIGIFFPKTLRERFGVMEEEHMLLKNLKKLSVREQDIDQIVLSHLHFDHCGGLISPHEDGNPRLLFPNAKIYVPKKHFGHATKPTIRDRTSFIPMINDLIKNSGRVVYVDSDRHPDLNFGVRFHYFNGHTVGLMTSTLATENGPVVFISDLIPGASWMHLPIAMGYDRFPELTVQEKGDFLPKLLKQNAKILFTHDPLNPMATIQQDKRGRFFAAPLT